MPSAAAAVTFRGGALLSQKSKFLTSLNLSRGLHTMTANMAGHRIEQDTFGKTPPAFRNEFNFEIIMTSIFGK